MTWRPRVDVFRARARAHRHCTIAKSEPIWPIGRGLKLHFSFFFSLSFFISNLRRFHSTQRYNCVFSITRLPSIWTVFKRGSGGLCLAIWSCLLFQCESDSRLQCRLVYFAHFTSPKSYRKWKYATLVGRAATKKGKRGDQCANIASRGEKHLLFGCRRNM